MNACIRILLLGLLLPCSLLAQIRWQTTHDGTSSGECQLQSTKLTLTVNAFSIDVVEEAVMAALGPVGWGDPATLEIVGTFTFSRGTALRSMLLWNGSKLLKAKLKERNAADSAYEQVVDRDKPQPVVRDPALIEYLGDNRYQFKIYPVAANGSRRIRILYTVPLQVVGNGPQFQVYPAFVAGARDVPTQVPVEVRRANGADTLRYIMHYGSVAKTVQFGATYQVPYSALAEQNYYWWNDRTALPLIITPDTVTTAAACVASIDSGAAAGKYMAVFASPPDTVAAAIEELSAFGATSLEARIVSGEKTYITDFNGGRYLGVYLKSTAGWDSTVRWTVYDSRGRVALECRQVYQPQSDSLSSRMLPLIWGAKYSLVEGNGNLGALFGFVDRQMSLLALESDTLPVAEAGQWLYGGVPPLKSQEIVLKPSHLPATPRENIIFEYGTRTVAAVRDNTARFDIALLAGRMVALRFAGLGAQTVKVELLDMAGRVVQTWERVQVGSGTVQLALPRTAQGCLVMRVHAGTKVLQKTFAMR